MTPDQLRKIEHIVGSIRLKLTEAIERAGDFKYHSELKLLEVGYTTDGNGDRWSSKAIAGVIFHIETYHEPSLPDNPNFHAFPVAKPYKPELINDRT